VACLASLHISNPTHEGNLVCSAPKLLPSDHYQNALICERDYCSTTPVPRRVVEVTVNRSGVSSSSSYPVAEGGRAVEPES
jgi:hypothetical protein